MRYVNCLDPSIMTSKGKASLENKFRQLLFKFLLPTVIYSEDTFPFCNELNRVMSAGDGEMRSLLFFWKHWAHMTPSTRTSFICEICRSVRLDGSGHKTGSWDEPWGWNFYKKCLGDLAEWRSVSMGTCCGQRLQNFSHRFWKLAHFSSSSSFTCSTTGTCRMETESVETPVAFPWSLTMRLPPLQSTQGSLHGHRFVSIEDIKEPFLYGWNYHEKRLEKWCSEASQNWQSTIGKFKDHTDKDIV